MKLERILWLAFVVIFVLPPALYFIVNGYWWLFDDHLVDGSKMFVSFFVAAIAAIIAITSATAGEIWS